MGPDLPGSLWNPRGRRGVRLLLLPVLLLISGCAGDRPGGADEQEGIGGLRAEGEAPEGFPVRLVDAAGDTILFQDPPGRIISLVPSASQILLALGAGRHLVGRTDFDTARALAHLPSVGGGLNPSLEAIAALDPDLVIRFGGESDPTTSLRLHHLGIPHVAVRPDGLRDIQRTIRQLGMVTGMVAEADSILDAMARDLERLETRVAGRPPVRVAYILGGSPPWVAGPGSYLQELLELAGGVNVFSDLEGLYGPVNAEVFLVREMDLILAPEGAEVVLPEIPTPLRRVSPGLEIPGPELARQAWSLARILHPGAFR